MIRVNIALMDINEAVVAVVVWALEVKGLAQWLQGVFHVRDGGDDKECRYKVLGLFLCLVFFVLRSETWW